MTQELLEFYKRFPTQEKCIKHLEKVFWSDIPTCPYCNSTRHTSMPQERRYHCGNCITSYSVTVKTIFHKTKVDLQKWFYAINIISATKISARQLAIVLEVTKDTACFMVSRIKNALIENRILILSIIK